MVVICHGIEENVTVFFEWHKTICSGRSLQASALQRYNSTLDTYSFFTDLPTFLQLLYLSIAQLQIVRIPNIFCLKV